MVVRVAISLLRYGPFALLLCALAWWPLGPGHEFLPFMPWTLRAVGAGFGLGAVLLWLMGNKLFHSGFRSAAAQFAIASALAFWPGTWWCLFLAMSASGLLDRALRQIVSERAQSRFPTDPFSREAKCVDDVLHAMEGYDRLCAAGGGSLEEYERLAHAMDSAGARLDKVRRGAGL